MVNNGSWSYDHDRDGTHTQLAGCEVRFRNVDYETLISIRYENDILSVSTDLENRNEWKSCFVVNNVELPTGYYFGMSATTGDLSDNHDIHSFKFFDVDSNISVSVVTCIKKYFSINNFFVYSTMKLYVALTSFPMPRPLNHRASTRMTQSRACPMRKSSSFYYSLWSLRRRLPFSPSPTLKIAMRESASIKGRRPIKLVHRNIMLGLSRTLKLIPKVYLCTDCSHTYHLLLLSLIFLYEIFS